MQEMKFLWLQKREMKLGWKSTANGHHRKCKQKNRNYFTVVFFQNSVSFCKGMFSGYHLCQYCCTFRTFRTFRTSTSRNGTYNYS
jgi:hypothetical protein